jgi:CRP/FNR family cyclic AMP-dependent transcriptional regulator
MDTKTMVDLLQGHPFLQGLLPGDIAKMAEIAQKVQFSRDQIIFRQGDEAGLFYVVLSGKVALEASAPGRILRVQAAGPGEELGWSSVLGESGKHFQARAMESVEALMFDGSRLRQLCDEDPVFGYRFLLKLLRVVARRLQATRVQLLDLYAPVHGGSKLI